MMKEIEINQIICKAMGKCWHEFGKIVGYFQPRCIKCFAPHDDNNPSYTSSWEVYGKMLEWLQSDKTLWHDFFNWLSLQTEMFVPFVEVLLNPLRGSTAIAEFLKERK